MTRRLADDCFVSDKPRLSHAEAIAILRDRIKPVTPIETVGLSEAAGRILAEPVVTSVPVPMHTNAAVDGYAFAHADYDAQLGTMFEVSGRAAAGLANSVCVPRGTAVRIFTGAALPEGVDTCAMQEDCRSSDGGRSVYIPAGLKGGSNVRKAGEDVAAGTVLMRSGERIRPQDVAALASVGLGRVPVYEPLQVGLLSSGDEIVAAGQPLRLGQVYDSNRPMLHVLATSAGSRVVDLGVAPDRRDDLEARLADAARRCHVIITSGGASRGEEDHLVPALAALGKCHLWQIAIKPGRPMSFGQIGDCVVLGLPGNPVAVFVCFLLYAWPLLRCLGGGVWPEPQRYLLPAAFEFKGRKTGRREYWRGSLVERDGRAMVDKFARDGSGLISGLRAADGLIEVDETHGDVNFGDLVRFIPLSSFGIVR